MAALAIAAQPAAAQAPIPTNQDLEEMLVRDMPRHEIFRDGCEPVPNFWKGSEDSVFDANPFRTVLRFPGNPQSEGAEQALRASRALARAGLLEEQPIAGGGAQFRITTRGWALVRPGGALCFHYGTSDQVRVSGTRLAIENGAGKIAITYTTGFSGTAVLEPWARDATVTRDLRLFNAFTRPQTFKATAVETAGKWAIHSYREATPLSPAPALTPDAMLRLVVASIPEAKDSIACFPLPTTRPQLGIKATSDGDYVVIVDDKAGLNRTQAKFIDALLEDLGDMEKSGILERMSPRSFRLAGKLRGSLRGECLVLGKLAPRLVATAPSSIQPNLQRRDRAWFKVILEATPDPAFARAFPAVLAQKDIRFFLTRGTACEGWLRYEKEWAVARPLCYPAY